MTQVTTNTETTHYLELSEEDGGAHKFYEVTVAGTEVTVRYGRIGDAGQRQQTSFATADQARSDAQRKVAAKTRKGYEPAVRGVRQKRPVTRRQITSSRSTARRAPVLWRYASGASAFGVFVDGERCMVGNERGRITTLSHDGEVLGQVQLPDGVKCIVADDAWLYAGCDNGSVYDLSGKVPRASYEIAPDVDIYWMDIWDGSLAVSDARGGVTVVDHEDELQWRRSGHGTSAWMVRCDENGVYHGSSDGVTMHEWRAGHENWHQGTRGSVLFGWQERETVYAGTSGRQVHAFGKNGKVGTVYQCDASVFSCAAADDGRYVFAGDNHSSVYSFDADGNRLWKLGTGCGSAFSMQYHDGRLYIVTTDGSLACIDASEAAIQAAQAGNVPTATTVTAPQMTAVIPSAEVATTSDASGGIVVECMTDGGKLRVRTVTPGLHAEWNVQFPKGLRRPGARFVVDGLEPSARGGFYRVRGDIRQLV